jgi:hypothetical protein
VERLFTTGVDGGTNKRKMLKKYPSLALLFYDGSITLFYNNIHGLGLKAQSKEEWEV